MRKLGVHSESGKTLFIESVSSVEEFRLQKSGLDSRYFGLFLICDASSISDAAVLTFATCLVEQGLAFVKCWGQDCERVHDLFDRVIVKFNPNENQNDVILTTWSTNEKLADALWRFLYVDFPASEYEAECKSRLILLVNSDDWIAEVIANIARLSS